LSNGLRQRSGIVGGVLPLVHSQLLARADTGGDHQENHPSLFFSLSSEVAPFVGEYERTATTVLNAYIGPRISAYLKSLSMGLKAKGLRSRPLIMQAYGGVLSIEASCKSAVGTIESGPTSGVVGSQFLGRLMGEPNILATDMGGTTFKVSVIRDGVIERDYKPIICAIAFVHEDLG